MTQNKKAHNMNLEEFRKLLPEVCQKETSSDPTRWTKENPLYGHCAIVALEVQRRFKGKILRASLEGTPFASMRSHYINQLPTGERVDFSADQFGSDYPEGLEFSPRTRRYVLSSPDTAFRYKIFRHRLQSTQAADRRGHHG